MADHFENWSQSSANFSDLSSEQADPFFFFLYSESARAGSSSCPFERLRGTSASVSAPPRVKRRRRAATLSAKHRGGGAETLAEVPLSLSKGFVFGGARAINSALCRLQGRVAQMLWGSARGQDVAGK